MRAERSEELIAQEKATEPPLPSNLEAFVMGVCKWEPTQPPHPQTLIQRIATLGIESVPLKGDDIDGRKLMVQ